MEKTFTEFWNQQAKWSEDTFGGSSVRGPRGPLLHLLKEVAETLAEPDYSYRQAQEIVDCFFLVIDVARRAGYTHEGLIQAAFEKLEINKNRKWIKTGINEPMEHDRG